MTDDIKPAKPEDAAPDELVVDGELPDIKNDPIPGEDDATVDHEPTTNPGGEA